MKPNQTIITATVNMAKSWINVDESAKQMLDRVLKERRSLLLPHPLHRVPLGVNNILEIIGSSPSAKTEILLQVAVTCILPKNRNGVQYGGLEHSVFFLDLDCRLDIFSLSESLKIRINKQKGVDVSSSESKDVFIECMRRFSYTRCYDSFEFLAALKVLHHKLKNETNPDGVRVLMIDSIGAFYWIDRGFSSLPQGRKNISLQSVFETVVLEIKNLLVLHPMLVLATKMIMNQVKSGNVYREFMPLIWQSFVTHRVLVRALEDERKLRDQVIYLAEWLLPALNVSDKFVVSDSGILTSF